MTIPAWSAPELLTLAVAVGDRSARVTAAGEIDACTAPQLTAAIDEALTAGPVTTAVATGAAGAVQLTVDLSAVTFLDSAGVHALAGAHRRATAAGGRLTVCATRRAVLRPLQVSGLWQLVSGTPDGPTAETTATGDAA